MIEATDFDSKFVTVHRAAALLGLSPEAVLGLLERNEVESVVLIQADSLRSLMAARAAR